MKRDDRLTSLPLFPLRTVLYPGGLLPLRIFEPRYVTLVRDCMRDGTGFGVAPIRHGGEAGEPAEPWPLGTCGEIIDFDQGADGLLHILVKGAWRFRLSSHRVNRERLLIGEVERIDDDSSEALPQEIGELKSVLQKVLEIEAASGGHRIEVPYGASATVYRLMERLPFPLAVKLEILECARTDLQVTRCREALEQLMQQRAT